MAADPSRRIPGSVWIWAALLVVLLVAAVQYLHFVVKVGNPAESAPPAIAVLFAFAAAGGAWLWRRLGGRTSTPGLFLLYIILLVAAPIAGIGFFQRFIVLITLLMYRATEANGMLPFQEHVPPWFCPRDFATVAALYEGGAEAVPWGAWALPIAFWTVFMTAFFVLLLAVMALLRRQWVERERLVFPLAVLPAQLVSGSGGRSLVAQRLFWLGFALALSYQLACGANHYLGLVQGWGHTLSPFAGIVERPWRQLNMTPAISLRISLTVLGLGFLINQEISFSIWASIVLINVAQIAVDASGASVPGFPNPGAQALGGFFVFGLLSLWLARRHLGTVFGKAFGLIREPVDADEPLSYRLVVFCLLGGFAVVCGALVASGMPAALAAGIVVYFVLMAVTYARIRAECGAPIIWCLPFAGIPFIGTLASLSGSLFADPRSMTLVGMLGFLTLGFFPALAATQMESFKLAGLVGLPARTVPKALVLACALGIVASFGVVLPMFYLHDGGANSLAPFETTIIWHSVASIKGVLIDPRVSVVAWVWNGIGGAIVALLTAARFVFLRFPLHPIGYIVALTYGGAWMFGCIFLAWLIKTLVLSYGGVRLFRLLVPFFLALPVGEFAGIGFWYLVAPFINMEAYLIAWG